jgi:hypothetical protein
MIKTVITSSASLQTELQHWRSVLIKTGHEIIDWPKPIDQNNFIEDYPDIHIEFFKNIEQAEKLFVLNADRKGIEGNIGAETFAEMAYALARKLVHNQNIDIVLLKEPSREVQC